MDPTEAKTSGEIPMVIPQHGPLYSQPNIMSPVRTINHHVVSFSVFLNKDAELGLRKKQNQKQ